MNAYQIPLRVIQDEILRTRAWDRWTFYRDLAKERHVEAKKAETDLGYRFRDDPDAPFGRVLDVTVNRDGVPIPTFTVTDFRLDPEKGIGDVWTLTDGLDIQALWGGPVAEFAAFTRPLVTAEMVAGNL